MAGNYTVTFKVSNKNGTNSKTILISVTDTEGITQKPVADFSSNVTSGSAPLSVAFTDKRTGSPTSWSWRFGDGTYSYRKVISEGSNSHIPSTREIYGQINSNEL